MIESPRWLWSKGRSKECIKQLRRIAKYNNRNLKLEAKKDLHSYDPTIRNSKTFGPLALFSGWKIALNTVLQLMMW